MSPMYDVEKVEVEDPVLDLLDYAWTILANAGGGDWNKETPEWQIAIKQWRSRYFAFLTEMRAKRET